MNDDLNYRLALDRIERTHRQKLTWLRQLAPNWSEFQSASERIPGQWTKVVVQTVYELQRAEEQHRATESKHSYWAARTTRGAWLRFRIHPPYCM